MSTKAALVTAAVVFLIGAALPGLQSTLHPRPWVDDLLRVLYFLERPDMGDRGALVMSARIASIMIWAVGLGALAGLIAGRPARKPE